MQLRGAGRIGSVGLGLLTATLFAACGSDEGSSSGQPPSGGMAGAMNGAGGGAGLGGEGPGDAGGSAAVGGSAAGGSAASGGTTGGGGTGSNACAEGYRDAGEGECAPLLLGLETSSGELAPELSESITSYSVTLPVGVTNILFTPRAPEGARVSIAGEDQGEDATWTSGLLGFGKNEIQIVVSEEGSPSTSYTVSVIRGVSATYVKGAKSAVEDRFGERLSLSADGKTLAVASQMDDGDAKGVNGTDEGESVDSGAVYVFTLVGGAWQQQAYLKSTGAAPAGDQFGSSVSLSADGNTLAVGAMLESSNAGSSGAVYMFTRDGDQWTSGSELKASNWGAGDFFGIAVDLSDDGSVLAVGAVNENGSSSNVNGVKNNNLSQSGAAYVYSRSGDTWTEDAYVKASHPGTTDRFGEALALSADGRVLAVAARLEDGSTSGVGGADDDAALNAGAVYVYEKSGSAWSDATYIKSEATMQLDTFGTGVALSADGTRLAVGANGADGASDGSGAVYVYTKSANAWGQGVLVKPAIGDGADHFGTSVAFSTDGRILAVGAPNEASNATLAGGDASNNLTARSGAAYTFAFGATGWTQTSYVKATNTGEDDNFGQVVALSADGVTLAVGAWGESGSATGIDGADDDAASMAGAAYVYR